MSAGLGELTLTENQIIVLTSLAGTFGRRPPYLERPYPGSGWVWGSHSSTIRLLEPLASRGLVSGSRGVYRLTAAGHATVAGLVPGYEDQRRERRRLRWP